MQPALFLTSQYAVFLDLNNLICIGDMAGGLTIYTTKQDLESTQS
jgi:hypothetical protein